MTPSMMMEAAHWPFRLALAIAGKGSASTGEGLRKLWEWIWGTGALEVVCEGEKMEARGYCPLLL